MPNDTFRWHNGACRIWVVFLALQSWNSNLCFRGSVAMWELSLGIPTRSSRRPHGEPLSDTMLAPSSSPKVAVHFCVRVCIQSSKSLQHQTILWGRRHTFSFAPYTCVNFTLIFLNQTSYLYHCFLCMHKMENYKNYQQFSWIAVHENILTVAVSTVRNKYIV